MKLTFQNAFQTLMFYFEVELLLKQRLGGDLGKLLLSFLKEDPKPWHWPWTFVSGRKFFHVSPWSSESARKTVL